MLKPSLATKWADHGYKYSFSKTNKILESLNKSPIDWIN